MEIKLTNVYGNTALTEKGFKADYGNAFLIETDKHKVLYDTGWNGNILIHNLNLLGVSPDSIDTLILSHGHFDHTGGLLDFLLNRKNDSPLPTIAHPDVMKHKKAKLIGKIFFENKVEV